MRFRPSLSLLAFSSVLVGVLIAVLVTRLSDIRPSTDTQRAEAPLVSKSDVFRMESEQLGVQIQLAVSRGRKSICMTLCSTSGFGKRVHRLGGENHRRVATALHLHNFWNEIVHSINRRGGRFELLGFRTFDEKPCLCFRRIREGELMDYFFALVERMGQGEVGISDIYSLNKARWLADITPRVNPVTESSGDFVAAQGARKSTVGLRSIIRYYARYRQWTVVHKLIEDSLPLVIQQEPDIAYWRWVAAYNCGRQPFLQIGPKVMSGLSSSATLVLRYFLHETRGETAAALSVIDELERQVQGDPYLDYYRARVAQRAGNMKEALPIFQRIARDFHKSWGAHMALIDHWIKEQNGDELGRALMLTHRHFQFDHVPLLNEPRLAWFRNSSSYDKYVAQREELLAPRQRRTDELTRIRLKAELYHRRQHR